MTKALAAGFALAALLATSANAGAPPSTLKATVKGNDVSIVNGTGQTYTGFFINSTDSPKITAASDKSCKMGTSPWSSSGKKHVDYWANCSASVAAGKTLQITLTTTGGGPIWVWAETAKQQYKIGTGN
jgi:hypothetical protein